MLKKRIIPCLDIADGRTVKGTNFINLRDMGDPVELATYYSDSLADELILLDIHATKENRSTTLQLVSAVANNISIPFTIGGGISQIEDVDRLLDAGADKVSINSAAVKKPELIDQLANKYGSQCIVVAIDTQYMDQQNTVFIQGGNKKTDLATEAWAKEIYERGAGEILLTSMGQDGVQKGFDLPITQQIAETIDIPIIASGGAGSQEDFLKLFQQTQASAGLAASIFHNRTLAIPTLKNYLNENKIPVRCN